MRASISSEHNNVPSLDVAYWGLNVINTVTKGLIAAIGLGQRQPGLVEHRQVLHQRLHDFNVGKLYPKHEGRKDRSPVSNLLNSQPYPVPYPNPRTAPNFTLTPNPKPGLLYPDPTA